MILLGVNAFPAKGDGARRQTEALATWRELRGSRLANLQWADDVFEVEGFETHPVLRADSTTVTGRSGRRLPVLSEAFDRLADLAEAGGLEWFGYANSDISITQAAVDRVLSADREGYAFGRMDFDPETREDVEMVTAGIDLFALRVDWWRANRRRFRAYIGGETIWDNVYVAILLAHADAVLLNRDALIRHERHAPADWRNSPFARYLNWLAARDRPYFTLWVTYFHRLMEMRAHGLADEAEELRMQREVFKRRPSPVDRVVQSARVVKAAARWATIPTTRGWARPRSTTSCATNSAPWAIPATCCSRRSWARVRPPRGCAGWWGRCWPSAPSAAPSARAAHTTWWTSPAPKGPPSARGGRRARIAAWRWSAARTGWST
jgi:hypothetical protein